jgi:hypothetical protein
MTTSDSPSQPRRRIAPAWVALSLTLVLALAAGGLGIVRAAPGLQETPPPDEPLTDIAGPQPESDVSADEAPDVRLAQLGLSDLPDPGFEVIYPPDEALPEVAANFTQALPLPDEPLVAPDPFVEPPLYVDIYRGGEAALEASESFTLTLPYTLTPPITTTSPITYTPPVTFSPPITYTPPVTFSPPITYTPPVTFSPPITPPSGGTDSPNESWWQTFLPIVIRLFWPALP